MPTLKWTIKLEEAYAASKKHWDKRDMLREIDRRAYFEGFKVGKEKMMFQEELRDLEITYKATLINIHSQVEEVLPSLLHYMEKFITLHKQNEAVREKLDTLLVKTGRSQDEDEGEDDE